MQPMLYVNAANSTTYTRTDKLFTFRITLNVNSIANIYINSCFLSFFELVDLNYDTLCAQDHHAQLKS